MVDAQNAVVPESRIEDIPFVQQQLPPDHFVPGLGVAGELDAVDRKLFVLVEIERQVDEVALAVGVDVGVGGEVDISELAVNLGVVFHPLPHLGEVKDVPGLELEDLLEQFLLDNLVATDEQPAHPVLLAFFDGDGEVHRFPAPPTVKEKRPAAFRVHHLDDGLFRQSEIIPVFLVEFADFFQVVLHLIFVVGFVEQVEPRRRPCGAGELHGAHQAR